MQIEYNIATNYKSSAKIGVTTGNMLNDNADNVYNNQY